MKKDSLEGYIHQARKIVYVQSMLSKYRTERRKDLMYQNIDDYIRVTLVSDGVSTMNYGKTMSSLITEGAVYKHIPGLSPFIKVNKEPCEFTLYPGRGKSLHINSDDVFCTEEWLFQNSLIYDNKVLKGLIMMKYIQEHATCPAIGTTMSHVDRFYKLIRCIEESVDNS